MNYNLSAELRDNLEVYRKFAESRSSVSYPDKPDVPLVWDLYMDTQRPVGSDLAAETRQAGPAAPIDYAPAGFEGPAAVTYQAALSGEGDLLGLVNDRLKTQSRRYPHPITNELEDFR